MIGAAWQDGGGWFRRGVFAAIATLAIAFSLALAGSALYPLQASADQTDLEISTIKEWNDFAASVNDGNSYEGKTVTLNGNLDFTVAGAASFVVAGNAADKPFKGTFDGGYHTITVNLNGTDEQDFLAVFGNVSGSAVVSNFKVAGSVAGAGKNVAGAVAFADGAASIRNVGNDAKVTGTSEKGWAAGILAHTAAGDGVVIVGSYNKAEITSANYAGGVLAVSESEKGRSEGPTVTSCYNTGAISSDGCASGIVGRSSNGGYSSYAKIYNCFDAGDYETDYYHSYFSGSKPYVAISTAQANYYKTPVSGGYVCGSSYGVPDNYNGVTAKQLVGTDNFNGNQLFETLNTSVAKENGIEWLPGKRLKQMVPCLSWEIERVPGEPIITAEPKLADNAHGVTGVNGVSLAIAARKPASGTGSDGALSFQWYEAGDCDNPNPESDMKVGEDSIGVTAGEVTAATVETPKSATAGTHGYYCVVTNTFGDADTAVAVSDVVKVVYLNDEVAKPTIETQPESVGEDKTQLDEVTFSISAGVSDGGSVKYQWCHQEPDENGEDLVWVPVDAEVNPTAETATFKSVNYGLGEHAFKCVVTNERDGFLGEPVDSEEATVTYVAFPVRTASDLARVRDAVNQGSFVGGTAELKNDIDLSSVKSWQPIGTSDHPFTGTLTAERHVTIANMKIADTGDDATGNVALVGFAKGATLENFTVTGDVESDKPNIAGVLAVNMAGGETAISQVGNEAAVKTNAAASSQGGVGGLVGTSLTSDSEPGGLSIEKSYNKGAISSTSQARNFGGLVGFSASRLSLADSYNVGSITTGGSSSAYDTNIGGLVGDSYTALSMKRCYNAGTLAFFYSQDYGYGGSSYGGLIGSMSASKLDFESNYFLGAESAFTWNSSASDKPTPRAIGSRSVAPNEAPTSMMQPSDARNLGAAYSAVHVPRANKGYPRLSWELEYIAPDYAVSFDVTGTDDSKVESPTVTVKHDGQEVSAGSDGSYKLTEDQTYSYTVSAGDKYGTAEGTVTPVPEDAKNLAISVPVTLSRFHSVKFKVVTKSDGSSVEGAEVEVVDANGDAVEAVDGNFRLEHGAVYSYAVSKDGYDDAAGEFTASEDNQEITVTLEAGWYTVTFAATDVNGAAIEGFTTTVTLAGVEIEPASDGAFKLQEGNVYSYTISADGYNQAAGTINPSRAETVTVALSHAGCVLTVVNQYGAAKEYTTDALKALATDPNKGNSTTLRMQSSTQDGGYSVKAAKKDGYVTLANLLADAQASWKHGYKLHIWTGDAEYRKVSDTTFESIDAMKYFYPLASTTDKNNTTGASDANPFSLSWEYYETGCPEGTLAGAAVEEALKGEPQTSGIRVLAGAWLSDKEVQSPGWRTPSGVTKIEVERYDADMLKVVNQEGVSTTFKLSELKSLAAKNTSDVKMQYAGKNGGTVKVAEKDDYATLDAIFAAADVTWGEGYELSIYDSTGTIYAPGEKWTDTSYAAVSKMKYFYPNSKPSAPSEMNREETPMALAWTTHSNAWTDTTAQAAVQGAKDAPARDEFRLFTGGWVENGVMQVPGWRSAQDITKITVSKIDYTSVDKKALNAAILAAQADKDATAQSEDGSDVANGKHYASAEAHTALSKAIAAAKEVANSPKVTQGRVNGALSALNAAVAEFDAAKKEGSVSTKALSESITAAGKAKSDIKKSVKGTDVLWTEKWVASATFEALDNAIAAANKLIATGEATQAEVDAAKKTLDDKTAAFKKAIKDGTKAIAASKLSASVKDQVYSGKSLKPTIPSIKYSGKTLKADTDYTLAYSNNKNVGTAKVTIKTKKGTKFPLSGTKTVTFKINPKGTKVSSVTSAKKQITVKWAKQATQTGGYQVMYATNSKFTGSKTVTVNGAKTTSKKITGLKAKTKYYVKVRTFKKVGKVTYYSAWSAAKAPSKLTTASVAGSGLVSARIGL